MTPPVSTARSSHQGRWPPDGTSGDRDAHRPQAGDRTDPAVAQRGPNTEFHGGGPASSAFADLTSPQVAELLRSRRRPVLLLPVGAVEPHGPHAPLATDEIISSGMCERAAGRLTGDTDPRVLTMPAVGYGVTRFGAAFPGAVSIGAPTLRALLVDICVSLGEQGFRHIVVVNNHFEPEHVAALRGAVDDATAASDAVIGYLDLVRRSTAARLTEEFRSGSCHAGRYETSLVLADRPHLVDTAAQRDLPDLPVDMPAQMSRGHRDFVAMGMRDAYCGAPAAATAAEGQTTFDTLTDLLVEVIRDVAAKDGG